MTYAMMIPVLLLSSAIGPAAAVGDAPAPRQMERLGRGVVAARRDGGVFVNWRLLGTDPDDVTFDVFRSTDGGPPVKLNRGPIAGPTGFADDGPDPTRSVEYAVRPTSGDLEPGETFRLAAGAPRG
jgi:rhamnogalacturonan endolyase